VVVVGGGVVWEKPTRCGRNNQENSWEVRGKRVAGDRVKDYFYQKNSKRKLQRTTPREQTWGGAETAGERELWKNWV